MADNAIEADAAGGLPPPEMTKADFELSIMGGDFKSRQAVSNEWVSEMKGAREMRATIFKCVVRPFTVAAAVLSFLMTLGLAVVMYMPITVWGDDKTDVPLLVHMGQNGASWPLGVFILGTFFSFAAFGAMTFGVITPSWGKNNSIKNFMRDNAANTDE